MLFGSFYNVVIYRIPLDLSIAKGRSMCPSCSTSLRAIDLVPLFSWIFLGRRCRYCKSEISLRYPLIELATGGLFLLSYLVFGPSLEALFYISLWSMLLITAMIDYDHMIISDAVLLFFTVVGIALNLFIGFDYKSHILGGIAGFSFYLLIYVAAKAIYKKEAFGFGDVMLIGAIGLLLGLRDTVLISILSFYVALFLILGFRLLGKKFSVKEEVPFGPYICISAFIVSLWGDNLVELYFRIFSM